MDRNGIETSSHLHFLGNAFHAKSIRHFFFVDLESVGGVVHKELYRLLYGRLSANAPVAVLLFRKQAATAKAGKAKVAGEDNANQWRAGGIAQRNGRREEATNAGKEMGKKEKEKQQKRHGAFEERCGGCSKIIESSDVGGHRAGHEEEEEGDERRMWVYSVHSPKHQMSFAASFLVERVTRSREGDPVNIYFVSNNDDVQQLSRQLKGLARLRQAVAKRNSEREEGGAKSEENEDDSERAIFHRLQIDGAGVWAKQKRVELMREAGLLTNAQLAADTDYSGPSSAMGNMKKSNRLDERWEAINPFSFFDADAGRKSEATAERTKTTDSIDDEGDGGIVKERRKEKDIDVVVRRVKYGLWTEHERGIILPRTLHDLRKKVRQQCAVEKRLDALAVLALLESSRLVHVCPICHDFSYSFDRYNAARKARKEAKASRAAARAVGARVDDVIVVSRSRGDEDGDARSGDGSEEEGAAELSTWNSSGVAKPHSKKGRKKTGTKKEERHSKADRTRRVAKAITLKLIKARKEDRPKGRRALLAYIDGHASYKTRIDAELVVARLTACGFVEAEARTRTQGLGMQGMLLGREDVAVDYKLDLLKDVDKKKSQYERASEDEKKRTDREENEKDGATTTYERTRRDGRRRGGEWKASTTRWGVEAKASEADLADQWEAIMSATGRGENRAKTGGGVGGYMVHMEEELKAGERYGEEITHIEECGLSDHLLRGFYAYGFEKPTTLQRKAIATIMSKRDVLMLGCSGTGKTAAYAVPLLHSIQSHVLSPQAIVLVPTRPLAQQVERVILSLGEYAQVKCALVTGGGAVRQCTQDLKEAQVVVATGGRLYDMINRGALKLDHVKLLVIDEVDDMISPTKRDLLHDVYKALPKDIQVCAVDTVVSQDSMSMLKNVMREPFAVITDDSVLTESPFPFGVDQYTLDADAEEHKAAALVELLGGDPVLLEQLAGIDDGEPREATEPRHRDREDDDNGDGDDDDVWGRKEFEDRDRFADDDDVDRRRYGPVGGDRSPPVVVAGRASGPPPPPPVINGAAQVVIFCNSKRKVDWLAERLTVCNILSLPLHEDMDPNEVQRGITTWRTGSAAILLTTDSLSFGLDVPQVNLVINYDLSRSAPGHVRRVGRAGRFARKGAAITFLAGEEDQRNLARLKAAIPFDTTPLPASLDLAP